MLCQHYWKLQKKLYEPRHDKTNKMAVRLAETQISLGSAQSDQSTLCAELVAKNSSFFMRTAKTDQTGRMPRLV